MDTDNFEIEKVIQKIDTLQKFDNFIGLLNYFHVSRCGKATCTQRSFTLELQYLWV